MGVGGHHAPATLPPRKIQYPLYRRLGGPQGQSGQVQKISPPPGFDPWTVQPVASRYTSWAILTHVNLKEEDQMEHSGLVWVQYPRESKGIPVSLQTTKTYRVQAQLHSLISEKEGSDFLDPCLCSFTPGEVTPVPTEHTARWATKSVWMCWKWENSLSLTKNRTPDHPAHSLITILTTPAQLLDNIKRHGLGLCGSMGEQVLCWCEYSNTIFVP
jgi:hypothetical protein